MEYAICNELFGRMDFEQVCKLIAKYGYKGIEIAPFTILSNQLEPADYIDFLKINKIKNTLRKYKLQFVGFHSLFYGFINYHLFSQDLKIRDKTYNHLRNLVRVVGEMGGGILILGSPQERKVLNIPIEEAEDILINQLKEMIDYLKENGAKILLEALPISHTNFINTLKQSKNIIEKIGSEQIQGMFDFHNCTDERLSWSELIDQYFKMIKHIHLNEINGSYPGSGASDFLPAFRILTKLNYDKWISMEIFDQPKDVENMLHQVREYLNKIEQKI